MRTTRTCVKCQKEKPIAEFNFSHKKLGYRRHECRECESDRKNGWFNANHARETHKRNIHYWHTRKNANIPQKAREKNREYQKTYRDNLKKEVFDHYGCFCACCGETEPKFLTLDHVNNDGYAMRKYKGHPPAAQAQFYVWIIRNNYPDSFQVLCMNCNFGKARNNGVCPHKEGSTTISQESTAKRLEAHRTQMGDDMVCSTLKDVAVLQ